MPMHDWSRIPAGLFHDFHQTWSIQIKLALNAGILPKGEPIGVGDILPEMPLFLRNGWQIPVPLESTYRATWSTSPEEFRVAVETGVMPELDAE